MELEPLEATEGSADRSPDLHPNQPVSCVSLPQEIVSLGKGHEGFNPTPTERKTSRNILRTSWIKWMDGAANSLTYLALAP